MIGVPDEVAGEVSLTVLQATVHEIQPVEKLQQLVAAELGASCIPTRYLALQELGLKTFPMTTSGKVRKKELQRLVLKHLSAEAYRTCLPMPNGKMETENAGSTMALLTELLARLLGQTSNSIPLDMPVRNLADSINILRLQAAVKAEIKKSVSVKGLMDALGVHVLAQQLELDPASNSES